MSALCSFFAAFGIVLSACEQSPYHALYENLPPLPPPDPPPMMVDRPAFPPISLEGPVTVSPWSIDPLAVDMVINGKAYRCYSGRGE